MDLTYRTKHNLFQASEFMHVLILGYSTKLSGGVVNVTQHLLNHSSKFEMHPILFCYGSPLKSVLFTFFSFLHFLIKILFLRKRYEATHIIIGSAGDSIRTIPFILLTKVMQLKICIQFHTSPTMIKSRISNKLLLKVIKETWKLSNTLSFLSPQLKTLHETAFEDAHQYSIIPNALPAKWLSQKPKPLTQRSKDIIFLGRWTQEKGAHDLTSAMSMLELNVQCEIYSDASKEESHSKCLFHPWVTEDQAQSIIRSAKILVLPSYFEAYPTVLLEAAACGTPFIATNIAGIPDIAKSSGAGLLITPGEPKELSQRIQEILLNDVLWNKLSKNGASWAKDQTIEKICNQWDLLYQKL